MNRFLQKVLFFGICSIIIFYILYKIPMYSKSNTYLNGIHYKHELLKVTSSPRLLLHGGSNIAFGIDSEKLEKELSIPVINLGIHAGLGATFIIEDLKSIMQPNDLIILSPEYFIGKGDIMIQKRAIEVYPKSANYIQMNLISSILFYLEYTQKKLKYHLLK